MFINSTEEIREFIVINGTTDWDNLSPYVQSAEKKFLKPLLGQKLFSTLNELNMEATESGGKFVELKELCQSVVANLSMFIGFDMLSVQFGDDGFTRPGKDQSLYRYQEDGLRSGFRTIGFDGIDDVLEYLYADLTTFADFKESTWYLEFKGSFFHTAGEFYKAYPLVQSRLVFLQISRFFERTLDFRIRQVLGGVLLDKVLLEMKKESSQNADLMALVPLIRKPLAYFSVAEGMQELGINISEKGIFFEMQITGQGGGIETTPLKMEQVQRLADKAEINGNRYLESLLSFLIENREKYEDYTQNVTTTNPYRRDNTNKKCFWA